VGRWIGWAIIRVRGRHGIRQAIVLLVQSKFAANGRLLSVI